MRSSLHLPGHTVATGVRNMAYQLEQIGGRKIFLALHTSHAPSAEEWRGWTELIEATCIEQKWDIDSTANFVITDGGAPNTAQRTVVNTLIAQAKTLPAVAVVTSSVIVRTMLRGFSIFNPNIAVFAPQEVAKAAEHVGIGRPDLTALIASCSRLEHDVLRPGAVETLGALTRLRL